MKIMRVMTTAVLLACLSIILTGTVVSQDSVFEGSIAVGTYGRLPSSGLYGASNAFPRNSTVRVTDAESGKSVDVLIVEGLSNPNIFLLLSPEAADRIAMTSDEVIRGKVIEIPSGDPVSRTGSRDQVFNPDPDVNPGASLSSRGEKEMIEDFIRNELAAMERPVEPLPPAEEEPREIAEIPLPEQQDLPEQQPKIESGPDIPRAVALQQSRPSDESTQWKGVSAPDLPAPPEVADQIRNGERVPPAVIAFPAGKARISPEPQVEWKSLPVPVPGEPGTDVQVVVTESETVPESRARLITSPFRAPLVRDRGGWEALDTPGVPRAVQDPLVAGKALERGEYRPLVADLPAVPKDGAELERTWTLAFSGPRNPPEVSEETSYTIATPEVRDTAEDPSPLLADDGPRRPDTEEEESTEPEEVPQVPGRVVGPLMVDTEAATPPEEDLVVETDPDIPELESPVPADTDRALQPVPEGSDLVVEKAELRPPEAPVTVEEPPEPVEEVERVALVPTPSPTPSGRAAVEPYLVSQLDESSYYLQLAAFREADSAGRLAQSLASTYPVTILPGERGSGFRVMVGPLRKDESGVLLVSFRAGGYRDAFVRKGN